MNSIRHRASLRQCAPNGIIIQNSTDNLPESVSDTHQPVILHDVTCLVSLC